MPRSSLESPILISLNGEGIARSALNIKKSENSVIRMPYREEAPMIQSADLSKWEDENRWDYVHSVLSLEAIAPLYDYLGVPLDRKNGVRFLQIVRHYYAEVYLGSDSTNPPRKRELLLGRIENTFGAEFREAYISWFLRVFLYVPEDLDGSWYAWRKIFMRCSVRPGWWQRLALPPDKQENVLLALEKAKAQNEDVWEIESSLNQQPKSVWDRRVIERMGLDERALAAGEPFTSIALTANLVIFYVFWITMLGILRPPEIDRLWEGARAVAHELEIAPEHVIHPKELKIELAR